MQPQPAAEAGRDLKARPDTSTDSAAELLFYGGGGGCEVASAGRAAPAWLVFLLLGLVLVRRRIRR